MDKIEKKRHFAKTITWRVIATSDTFLIAWLITGKIDWAAGIAGVEVLTKMFLYYWHERLWYKHIKSSTVLLERLLLNDLPNHQVLATHQAKLEAPLS